MLPIIPAAVQCHVPLIVIDPCSDEDVELGICCYCFLLQESGHVYIAVMLVVSFLR